MLSFLNPGLLWALPLAGIPVVLHLISLRRALRVEFSDLTLLREAQRRSLPATRLRQWALLAARCLMLAGLIAAFARPVLHPAAAAAAGSERGLEVVFLLDVSWSMGALDRGKPRIDWAAAAGGEMLDLLKASDRAAVAAFSDRLEGELAWAPDRSTAREALSRMRLGGRTGDAGPALGAAFRFLETASKEARRDGEAARRVIVVLSDNAAHLFKNLPQGDVSRLPGFDPRVTLLGLRWPEGLENSGVAGARPELRPGEGPSLWVQLAQYGRAREAGIGLWLRDRRADERAVRLEPGLGPELQFRLPAARDPELWGRLELRRDALPADDVFYYSLKVPPPPRVLLLYGSPSALEAGRGGYFLRQLLGETRKLPYELEAAEIGRLPQIRLEDFGAVLLHDLRRMPEGAAAALARYVIRGGGLWILPGPKDEEAYRELGTILPGRLGNPQEAFGPGSLFSADGSALPPAQGSRFSWNDFELKNIAVARRYALEPSPGAKVWFRDGGGQPLLVSGGSGTGRILVWASALDLDWTNLGLKPAFAAFIDAGLRHLTGYTGGHVWRTLTVGEPIVRVWGPGEAAPAKVLLRGPGGRRTTLLTSDRRVEYAGTDIPGIYFLSPLSGEGGAQEAYAVNLSRSGPEGDLGEAPRLPWTPLRPESLREDFLRALYGREARTGALGLVAALFILESLLSRPRPRTPPGAAPARPGRALEPAA